MSGPLFGIKVLDLSRVLAGPYCTAPLADLGAEVIKLEPPTGDDYRHIGPFKDGESALFTLNNRGKKSIMLNLKRPADPELAQAFAARVDVVVENFRPGVAARLGLGAKALRKANPRLIYCSISGFGQEGPFKDLPAYDLVVQAMSGLMAATGEEGGAPLKAGESIADLIAGLFASWSIMAALVQRNTTGQGATLDIAMYDALFSMLTTSHAQHFYSGALPDRVGNRHPLSTPFGCFKTSDSQVVIAVLNSGQFQRLAALIGKPEVAERPAVCLRQQSYRARAGAQGADRGMVRAPDHRRGRRSTFCSGTADRADLGHSTGRWQRTCRHAEPRQPARAPGARPGSGCRSAGAFRRRQAVGRDCGPAPWRRHCDGA